MSESTARAIICIAFACSVPAVRLVTRRVEALNSTLLRNPQAAQQRDVLLSALFVVVYAFGLAMVAGAFLAPWCWRGPVTSLCWLSVAGSALQVIAIAAGRWARAESESVGPKERGE